MSEGVQLSHSDKSIPVAAVYLDSRAPQIGGEPFRDVLAFDIDENDLGVIFVELADDPAPIPRLLPGSIVIFPVRPAKDISNQSLF